MDLNAGLISKKVQYKGNSTTGLARKSKKFVSFYSDEGKERQTVLLRGRHPCNCLASRHQLVNNCTSCGRIVCAQEGSGACFTCSELVASPRELEMLAKNSRKAIQLRQKIEEQDNALAAAIAHKDRWQTETDRVEILSDNFGLADKALGWRGNCGKKGDITMLPLFVEVGGVQLLEKEQSEDDGSTGFLLDFDRACTKKTQVIDDDQDYFSSDNKWLTQKERKVFKEIEEKRDKAKTLRGAQTLDIDFAERKVVVKNEEAPEVYLSATMESIDEVVDNLPSYLSNKELTDLEFIKAGIALKASTVRMTNSMQIMRLQDSYITEISDEGVCLSMHQPYASLLLAGIKKHEGRQWFHTHRGRLWIHAAAKQVTPAEIEKVLNTYRLISPTMSEKTPKQFPSGVLIGCVDIVDCLSQAKYREDFPQGEISDSYVFICENPQSLKTPLPMRGKAKIFKLEPRLHNAARKQVMFTPHEIH
ncbi:activating signal cointegrator 1-like [Tropilaelaps mercedesae]|uniref:Activating signal cointegrator 1-like n=1 Tax=Tropilaelaps mercedesae TaxID=418985 RepID=A0A1V9X3U0_9ACAR|nr:activating signal cointegrator 1-like [Tropilaelaps mercedesae]